MAISFASHRILRLFWLVFNTLAHLCGWDFRFPNRLHPGWIPHGDSLSDLLGATLARKIIVEIVRAR